MDHSQTKLKRKIPKVDNEELEINNLAYFAAHLVIHVTNVRAASFNVKPIFALSLSTFVNDTQERNDFMKKIVSYDATKFTKHLFFNRHNNCWFNENPHSLREN